MPDRAWKDAFARRLLSWFRRHARPLPWRASRDPYRVWVSEVMLQQTQVATVIPYFESFLSAFPTIAALAEAREDDVLKRWEGLGYYRRARQLHTSARIIQREHAGEFPRDEPLVRQLPGIGRYTAAAILSIAHDTRLPILEGNTQRVYSRLMALRASTEGTAAQRPLWAFAESILPLRKCGAFNQALMELGATICTPKAPRCDLCPVAALCPTHQRGLQDSIPGPRRRPRVENVTEVLVAIRRRGKILLVRHFEGRRWGRLWDFVRFPLTPTRSVSEAHSSRTPTRSASEEHAIREIRRQITRRTGLVVERCIPVTTIKHTVTRFRISLACLEATAQRGRVTPASFAETRWIDPSELPNFPLSTTARRFAAQLE
jgi:A/G-specific adenine glycosylase